MWPLKDYKKCSPAKHLPNLERAIMFERKPHNELVQPASAACKGGAHLTLAGRTRFAGIPLLRSAPVRAGVGRNSDCEVADVNQRN